MTNQWHEFFHQIHKLTISDLIMPRPYKRVYYRYPEMKFMDWRRVRYAQ